MFQTTKQRLISMSTSFLVDYFSPPNPPISPPHRRVFAASLLLHCGQFLSRQAARQLSRGPKLEVPTIFFRGIYPWLVVLTILKNMKVNGHDDIPYMKWKIKFMIETTNQTHKLWPFIGLTKTLVQTVPSI